MRKPKLRTTYARLFEDDVQWLRAQASERGSSFQIELRSLVREAVKTRRGPRADKPVVR